MSQPFSPNVLLKELTGIYHDFKSSVIGGEIISNGVPGDIIYFKNRGLFKRFISKEIEEIRWEDESEKSGSGRLVFDLNREGLYDMLPEALSHKEKKKTYEDYREKFEEQRQQEKSARVFFSPIENEFERRILQFDIIERELINNANERKTREFFEYFFGNSNKLSWPQVLALVYLLPLSYKIRSDLKLISLTLSKLLNYKIEVSKRFEKEHMTYSSFNGLGKQVLGVNSLLSDSFEGSVFCYEIKVFDVSINEYVFFKKDGRHATVINFIQPFFFPALADVKLCLLPVESEKDLYSYKDEEKCFLGFNSYI